MDPQSPVPDRPRYPYLGDGIPGMPKSDRGSNPLIPEVGEEAMDALLDRFPSSLPEAAEEAMDALLDRVPSSLPDAAEEATDALFDRFPSSLPAATHVFGNFFEITNCVCALQNPLLMKIHSPLEAASISSHVIAMLSVAPGHEVRCVATVEGFGERGCMNRAEWWTVALAICYQVFGRQEGFYRKGLRDLQIYQKVKADYQATNAPMKFDDFVKSTIFYHVHKFLIGFCYEHRGYTFATSFSVVSLLYNDKVLSCAWDGKIPQDFHVTLALENINAVPVSTFRARDDACMWQCIYTYVCVMDILGMQGAGARCRYRHDGLARVLGITDWLNGPESLELVAGLIPRRNLKRPLPVDA